jgi:hypothetical protein
MSVLFGVPAARLSIREIFIAKYTASGGQQALVAHRDGSIFSFNVLLSDPATEFEGGGTDFETLGITVAPGVGDVILHAGQMLHGGARLIRGTRYILVGFVDVVAPDVHAVIERAWVLRVAEEAEVGAAEFGAAVQESCADDESEEDYAALGRYWRAICLHDL